MAHNPFRDRDKRHISVFAHQKGPVMSAFAARRATQKPLTDVTNGNREPQKDSNSHSVIDDKDSRPPPSKRQRLEYDQRKQKPVNEARRPADTAAVNNQEIHATNLTSNPATTNSLRVGDPSISSDKALVLHADMGQDRIESAEEDLDSEYRTEIEDRMSAD